MVVIDGKEYEIEEVDETAYSSIFTFLKDNDKHKEIFLKRHGDEFKNIEEIEEDIEEGGDRILEVIEGDTQEIQAILDELATENEFYIADYMEREDIITIKKYKLIPVL